MRLELNWIEDDLNQNAPPIPSPFVCHEQSLNRLKNKQKKSGTLESEVWSLTLEPTVRSYVNLDHGLVSLCPLLSLDHRLHPRWFLQTNSPWRLISVWVRSVVGSFRRIRSCSLGPETLSTWQWIQTQN